MRRIFIIGALVLAVLFASLPQAKAACRPINGSTGVCDTGGDCSVVDTSKTGICCDDVHSECKNVNPADYNYETHDFTGTGTQPSTSTSNQGNIFCTKNGKQGISTALGCIVVEGAGFVTTLLSFGIGIAGGIAMLLIIFGGFQILTSAGNPERLNEGKELISSAITGLLMIVFSVFLLRIIGVDILGVPSFK